MEATFRKHKRSLFFKQRLMGYVFLLPTVVLFLIFTVVPFIMAFYLSFFEYNLLEVGEFVGFEYYSTAFSNTEFMKSFLNILIYAVMYVPSIIVISLLAAVLGNSELFGAKAMRIIFYLPCIQRQCVSSFICPVLRAVSPRRMSGGGCSTSKAAYSTGYWTCSGCRNRNGSVRGVTSSWSASSWSPCGAA